MIKFQLQVLALSLTFASITTYAQDINGIVGLGLEFGGDTLLSVPVTDGTTTRTKTMKAGQLALLTGGVSINESMGSVDMSTRVQLGFKADGIEGSNGRIDFFRWLSEVSQHVNIPNAPLMAGLGLTYHFSNTIRGEGVASGLTGDLKPSGGFFAQLEYFAAPPDSSTFKISRYVVGLRYTLQKYRDQHSTATVNANSFGINGGLIF